MTRSRVRSCSRRTRSGCAVPRDVSMTRGAKVVVGCVVEAKAVCMAAPIRRAALTARTQSSFVTCGHLSALRLLTWNVAGRVTRHPEQGAVVNDAAADIVALQEVTARTLPMWREALDLPHVLSSLDDGPPPKPRRLGVLIASREPLARRPLPDGLPWPERVLTAEGGGVEI